MLCATRTLEGAPPKPPSLGWGCCASFLAIISRAQSRTLRLRSGLGLALLGLGLFPRARPSLRRQLRAYARGYYLAALRASHPRHLGGWSHCDRFFPQRSRSVAKLPRARPFIGSPTPGLRPGLLSSGPPGLVFTALRRLTPSRSSFVGLLFNARAQSRPLRLRSGLALALLGLGLFPRARPFMGTKLPGAEAPG